MAQHGRPAAHAAPNHRLRSNSFLDVFPRCVPNHHLRRAVEASWRWRLEGGDTDGLGGDGYWRGWRRFEVGGVALWIGGSGAEEGARGIRGEVAFFSRIHLK